MDPVRYYGLAEIEGMGNDTLFHVAKTLGLQSTFNEIIWYYLKEFNMTSQGYTYSKVMAMKRDTQLFLDYFNLWPVVRQAVIQELRFQDRLREPLAIAPTSPRLISEISPKVTPDTVLGTTTTKLIATPSAWKEYTRDTSTVQFLQAWEKDAKRLIPLNKSIPPKQGLRVCTYNVHFWQTANTSEVNIDMVLADIKDINPDIVCLQEALLPLSLAGGIETIDGWSRDDLIEQFTRAGYKYSTLCATDNYNHSSMHSGTIFGNAIFSKLELKDLRYIELDADIQNRCAALATVNFKDKDVVIVSVHLDVFDATEDTRRNQIYQLLYDYGIPRIKAINVIIAGDFNSVWRKDYTENEWSWLKNNNRGIPLHQKVVELMVKLGYKEAFGDDGLNYSAWTARRVDYIWYKGLFMPRYSGVYYNDSSDHFPIFADFNLPPKLSIPDLLGRIRRGEDVRGSFDHLMFTHNTPFPVIYGMLTGELGRYIRCCDKEGVIGRGAQFRYGVDSQYGDFIFVTKGTGWWEAMKGVDPNTNPYQVKSYPYLGHFFWDKDGIFLPYHGKENKKKIDGWLLDQANDFTFRPEDFRGSGEECVEGSGISWCNTQMHLGDNVGFEHVQALLAPKWITTSAGVRRKLTNNGLNLDLLDKFLNNNLPFFPDGTTNQLNGKVILYGDNINIKDFYSFLSPDLNQISKFYPLKSFHPLSSYPNVDITGGSSTRRSPIPLTTSSEISISPRAFLDVEKIFMRILLIFLPEKLITFLYEEEQNTIDELISKGFTLKSILDLEGLR